MIKYAIFTTQREGFMRGHQTVRVVELANDATPPGGERVEKLEGSSPFANLPLNEDVQLNREGDLDANA